MTGQITLNTKAGKTLLDISGLNGVNHIVEIGTWNGDGSTRCILKGIENKNDAEFITIESDKKMYAEAASRLPKNITSLYGSIIKLEELDESNLTPEEKAWLDSDLRNYNECPNVLSRIPKEIDLLVLDGGEFSTRAEFLKLKDRCRYIFLDDTHLRKNKLNRKDLLLSEDFAAIEDSGERNGWSLFKHFDPIQLNKFSELHNGKTIHFCKTDFLRSDFEIIRNLDNNVILISGNSDYSIDSSYLEQIPSNVKKWYCQNKTCEDERLIALPLGIENTSACGREGHGYVWGHALEKKSVLRASFSRHNENPQRFIFANFWTGSNPTHREEIKKIARSKDYITWKEPMVPEGQYASYSAFVSDILNHQAVLCPQGNGRGDNHRIYETLYCNRVPIVFNQSQYETLYKEWPVVLIEKTADLEDEDWLRDSIREAKNKNNTKSLDFQYWKKKILRDAESL